MEIKLPRLQRFQKELILSRTCSEIKLLKVSVSEHAWIQNYWQMKSEKLKSSMKVWQHRNPSKNQFVYTLSGFYIIFITNKWQKLPKSSVFAVVLRWKKFVNSDEGLPCVNIIEKVYLGLLIAVFALGIVSILRLSHFKGELRKVFDSREGFLIYTLISTGSGNTSRSYLK